MHSSLCQFKCNINKLCSGFTIQDGTCTLLEVDFIVEQQANGITTNLKSDENFKVKTIPHAKIVSSAIHDWSSDPVESPRDPHFLGVGINWHFLFQTNDGIIICGGFQGGNFYDTCSVYKTGYISMEPQNTTLPLAYRHV